MRENCKGSSVKLRTPALSSPGKPFQASKSRLTETPYLRNGVSILNNEKVEGWQVE